MPNLDRILDNLIIDGEGRVAVLTGGDLEEFLVALEERGIIAIRPRRGDLQERLRRVIPDENMEEPF